MRYDTIDVDGKTSLRHSGRMLHLGIGRAHESTEAIVLIHHNHATVITPTGTTLAPCTLNPERGHQRKNG